MLPTRIPHYCHGRSCGGCLAHSKELPHATVFHWKHIMQDITMFITKCLVCQRALSQLTFLWTLFRSFLELRAINILVVVDWFTKYVHFIALSHPFITKEVAHGFRAEIVRLHRFTTIIVLLIGVMLSPEWTKTN